MRRKIIAGNWKMNNTVAEATALVEALKADLADCSGVEVVVCPPFTAIKTVSDLVADTQINVGAENMHFEKSGAFTGEISPLMLKELYVRYVILGHSERRAYFGENDEIVNKKAIACLASGMRPIVCVGETLEDREAGNTEAVVEAQTRGSLAGLTAEQMKEVVIAYEPVWAIGTGKTATSEQAQEVHAFIRSIVADLTDENTAKAVRIQYGGSMKPSNAAELLAQPDIDGGLIGGAALDAASFVDIVKAGM
jgi:triosephosphate isomerase